MRKYGSTTPLLSALVFVVFFSVTFLCPAKGVSDEREVMIIEIEGVISSGAATNLTRGIKEAEDRGAGLVIIQLDTPGGHLGLEVPVDYGRRRLEGQQILGPFHEAVVEFHEASIYIYHLNHQ